MREITLVNGKGVTMVDDGDFEMLSKHRWYLCHRKGRHSRYATTAIFSNGKWRTVYMQSLIMPTIADGFVRDHIDGNGLNNSRSNIRAVSQSINCLNSPMRSNNTSGHLGVYYRADYTRRPWFMMYQLAGKQRKFYFATKEAAIAARMEYDMSMSCPNAGKPKKAEVVQ